VVYCWVYHITDITALGRRDMVLDAHQIHHSSRWSLATIVILDLLKMIVDFPIG